MDTERENTRQRQTKEKMEGQDSREGRQHMDAKGPRQSYVEKTVEEIRQQWCDQLIMMMMMIIMMMMMTMFMLAVMMMLMMMMMMRMRMRMRMMMMMTTMMTLMLR